MRGSSLPAWLMEQAVVLLRFAVLAGCSIGAVAAFAQAPAPAPAMQPGETLAQMAATHFPQPVQVGSLLHRTVLAASESRNVDGHVVGVVRQDEQIKVVLDYGGVLGIGARLIAVPVEAMVLILHSVEVVGFTPAQLSTFPVYDGRATPLPPDATIRVGLARPTH